MKSKEKLTDKIVEGIVRELSPKRVSVDSKGLVDLLAYSEENKQSIRIPRAPQWPKCVRKINYAIYKHCPKIERMLSWFNVPIRKGMLLVMVLLTALGLLTFIIRFSINVINDVILYDHDYHINEQGTFNPRKSLNSDYALFLFNTSEVWANPGIQIHKGDRYRINISGGFNSSLITDYDASKNNYKIEYPWVYIGVDNLFDKIPTKKNDIEDLPYCLSRTPLKIHTRKIPWYKRLFGVRNTETDTISFNYGNILYSIMPESADLRNHPYKVDTSDIKKWEAGKLDKRYSGDRKFHKAETTGYLYFAINDLIFDDIFQGDTIIKTANSIIEERYINRIKEQGEKDSVKNNHSFHYEDNLGQMLVAVEIMHKTSAWKRVYKPMSTKVFCEFYELGTQLTSEGFLGKIRFAGECLLILLFFFITIFLHVVIVWIIVYLLFVAYSKISILYHNIFPSKTEKACT